MLKQHRLMAGLTLRELAAKAGVSSSHLARIEKGNRFPSGRILHKIVKALELDESQLLIVAGYLSPQPSGEEHALGRLDPYVAKVLSGEPVETQRTIIAILTILKSMTKGSNIKFREYAHRNYPQLDEDIITMVEDMLEHPPFSSQRV
ncbi:hypothetical protein ES705_14957 [subsurface metagenome]